VAVGWYGIQCLSANVAPLGLWKAEAVNLRQHENALKHPMTKKTLKQHCLTEM
jgi:hypothetical protein